MIDLIAHNLPLVMFSSVMLLLLLGYPVAFTLAAGGLIYFVLGVELSWISPEIRLFWPLLQSHPERIYGIMYNDTLLSIPFFTFMGIILERSRMAEDLLDTIGQLFGPIRGGLAYAVILVGALLGATTGVVAASVMAMGLISLPIMMRYGYNRPLVAGTIAASGTLAQIVPPSLVLIVMADQLGRSVGDMYVGALYPALLIIASYCAYIFAVSIFKPSLVPALPKEARTLGNGVTSLFVMIAVSVALYFIGMHLLFTGMASPEWRLVAALAFAVFTVYLVALFNSIASRKVISRLAEQVIIVLVPPLALIFLVLGTIFLGIATPTEGGAMGATGALILALAKGRLSLATIKNALDATTKLSAFVMMILIGARVFGLTFYGINGNVWIEELLLALPGGEYGFLVVVTIIIFILGCFLDFFEIAFIMVPLLAPVADKLGIDLVWFGIILGINLQTSFLTPPFGFSLFFLRSIAPNAAWVDKVTGKKMPGVKTTEIYRGVLPYIVIQFVMILVVIAFPGLVLTYKSGHTSVDPNSVKIEIPGGPGGSGLSLPPLGGGGASPQQPSMGLPPLNLGGPAAAPSGQESGAPTSPPSLGLPPLNLGGPQPQQPAQNSQPDLSQPPKIGP
ncbi:MULTISPECIES: TRAP transporter large permease [Agrobacterium]|uniref:TRAP transporter large permease n=1 Tax=Agrobacterium TaxID=357 RepID=UPI0022B84B6D|nr:MULTISPECIES: TRAP transporter large permease subunit [Agrobacterium]MCZ7885736.1 TRAP transporter large permease subunit [Agrobacterium salinitolerans]MDA5627327.1 TRAP transporter large permease subunit [Agrobacterium sp. ST15.16.055]MDA5636818.1 TRAP transporter large permease subunit [Agrobacterium sp. ST15.13.013]MDA6979348.1 TRAP transporter large permease subunit [Agrobacterium salinitolerans]MDA6998264.1 TRAP transporter large permease subunit [Agrobacterium salinitolerans]